MLDGMHGDLAVSFIFYLAIVLIANIFILLLSYVFDRILARTKLNTYIGIKLLLKLSFYILVSYSIAFFNSVIMIISTIVIVIHILLEFFFLESHTFKINSKRFSAIFQYSLISLAALFVAANLIIGFSY